jgi:hypothetical protein
MASVYGIWISEHDDWARNSDSTTIFHTPYQEVAAAQLRSVRLMDLDNLTREVRQISISGVAQGVTKLAKRQPRAPRKYAPKLT